MKRFMLVQHSYSEFLGMVEKQLESRNIGFQYQRPFLGVDLPTTATQHDALWLLGGAYPVTDEEANPWLAQELRLITNFKKMRRPIVGIGFGALVMVLHEGGEVSDEPYFNTYWTTCHKTEAGRDDPLANAVDGKKLLVMYNGSATLPEGMEPIVVDDEGRWLAVRPDDLSYAMLFRPEIKPGMIEDMMMEDNRPLPDNIGEILEQARANWAEGQKIAAEICLALVTALDLMTERHKMPVFNLNVVKTE
ncbi:GMP synthase [Sulfuriferula sp. AH1]|uniref:type 1 glutamine amidotransferase n=1 Tax=Sulfuriferula sp. AH1 TaxID=1985873 RepID=UPI000B3B3CA3|nr:GMP synthase [Sulfuriferula sp. AH1]ARU31540.1 GMP synthase [Sulfuriferula sp. AH1]